MTRLLTYAEDNQFSFVCPIFNAETKMAACLKLREMKWMGKKIEKRVGCQVAMSCSKCPATAIVDQITWGKHPDGTPDNYGSREPVVGKLRADILNKIRPVMIIDKVLNAYPVSDIERQLLLSANERIDEQLKTAPAGVGKYASRAVEFSSASSSARRRPAKRTAEPRPVTNNKVSDAARTGDLSAAISAAE